jgi:hypothetical protein
VPLRPIRVLYDRRDSTFARLGPDDVDWALVRGARVVHVSGITPALGAASRALVERAVTEAGELSVRPQLSRDAVGPGRGARLRGDGPAPGALPLYRGRGRPSFEGLFGKGSSHLFDQVVVHWAAPPGSSLPARPARRLPLPIVLDFC